MEDCEGIKPRPIVLMLIIAVVSEAVIHSTAVIISLFVVALVVFRFSCNRAGDASCLHTKEIWGLREGCFDVVAPAPFLVAVVVVVVAVVTVLVAVVFILAILFVRVCEMM